MHEWEPPAALMGTAFAARRSFFERHKKHRNRYITCPACGYPTLLERDSYEMCQLCHWEDEGQDDPNADDPIDGLNGRVSLAQARINFEVTNCIWGYGDDQELSPGALTRLLSPEIQEKKRMFRSLYDSLMTTEDLAQIRKIWGRIRYEWRNTTI